MKKEETTLPKSGAAKPLNTVISFSAIATAITTYSHFFGYSFLKGKLHALGFGNVEINLPLDESLRQTAHALTNLINSSGSPNIFSGIFPSAIVAGTFLLGYVLITEKNEAGDRKIKLAQKASRTISNNMFAIRAALAFIIGFAAPYIAFSILIFTLAYSWIFLNIGEQLGKNYIQSIIESGPCITAEEHNWEKQPHKFPQGCLQVTTNNSEELTGTLIYSNEDYSYLLTNDRAIKINSQREIVSYTPIIRPPSNKENDLIEPKIQP